MDHDEGRKIDGSYRDRLRALAGEGDRPWSALAAACLERGYIVEQESAILAAVRTWLGESAA
ncbi:hypothetical protein [Actinoallomurus sp. NPDC052274]|uniref:hypothetical protein n=1 Tax=Actinoallomurus sp. NPDC052274 TaxID=3155420 RepID=UPI00342BBC73